MTIRRSLVVGVVLGVAATVLLMLSPLGTVTSEAFDKVSVTRTSDDGKTEVAGSELNVSGATGDDIDRSLIGVATLGAIFLGLAAIIAGVVMISLRF
ncbi:MAG: hypothetical protein KDB24_05945 [Microthrixaceae bacterium]|nr:hypothetical protein [Microthrixaceae bacterium]